MNFLYLIALLILPPVQQIPGESKGSDHFHNGLEYLNMGETENAQALWQEAKEIFKDEEKADFRIGVTFIEYVTENKLTHLYPEASDFYLWSLNTNQVDESFDFISKEVEMLKHIISDDRYDRWRQFIDREDTSVYTEIGRFWSERNPVKSTTTNERLLEHWERITHARKHFNKNSSSIYGTDDRGIIFVRFGDPDIVYSGTIHLNTLEIRNKIYDLETFNHISSPEAAFNIRQGVVQSYSPQQYEYWRYYDLHLQPLFFLFGESADENYFGLLDRVESLIPDSAFKTSVVGGRGTGGSIRASSFLQFMLYNHLSNHDQFFGQMLNTFEDNWYRAVNSARLNGQMIQSQNSPSVSRDKMLEAYNRAPVESGNLDRSALKIPLAHKAYMFRDENMNPEFEIALYSDGLKTIKTDLHRASLNLNYGIVSVDHENRVTYENTNERILVVDSSDEFSDLLQPLSLMIETGDEKIYRGYLELTHQGTNHQVNSLHDDEMLVSGETEIRIDPHSHDPGLLTSKIMMSDLILGGTNQPQTLIRGFLSGLTADNLFREDENLHLYFEIYNSEASDTQTDVPLKIAYRVFPLDGESGKKVDIQESTSISGRVSEHYIEFEPWDLAPDRYKIEVSLYTPDQEYMDTICQVFTIY